MTNRTLYVETDWGKGRYRVRNKDVFCRCATVKDASGIVAFHYQSLHFEKREG